MTSSVFLAVLGAALLHALWNALVKGGSDQRTNMGAVTLGRIPIAVVALFLVPPPALDSLPYLFLSISLHLGYQFFLLQAYKIGDLSHVYPIARGSAPLIVAVVSTTALGIALAPQELLAVAIIGFGIASLAFGQRAYGLHNKNAAILALITGSFIASYSLIDGWGARVAGSSLGYYSWLAVGNAVVIALYLSLAAPRALLAIATKGRAVFFIGGASSYAAYALVTWAFTQSPIALVTAVRETSIIFAVLIGGLLFKERLNILKVVSVLITLGGVALLRILKL